MTLRKHDLLPGGSRWSALWCAKGVEVGSEREGVWETGRFTDPKFRKRPVGILPFIGQVLLFLVRSANRAERATGVELR